MSEFDLKASGWDKNAMHHERAEAVAGSIRSLIPLNTGMRALEFGAGTALLSFKLVDRFESITLVDSSKEMIRICNEKIQANGSGQLQALWIDLEKENMDGKYDVIYSQMTLHHVSDVEGILKKLYGLLDVDGFLAIADLYPEDGSFHGGGFTGHKGFDPESLSAQMRTTGFRDVMYQPCYILTKEEADGTRSGHPIFIMVAAKGNARINH